MKGSILHVQCFALRQVKRRSLPLAPCGEGRARQGCQQWFACARTEPRVRYTEYNSRFVNCNEYSWHAHLSPGNAERGGELATVRGAGDGWLMYHYKYAW